MSTEAPEVDPSDVTEYNIHQCLTLTVPVTTIDALQHFETG